MDARLGPAQRTCVTLDERAGKEVGKFIVERHHTVLYIRPFLPFTLIHSRLAYPVLSFIEGKKKSGSRLMFLVPQFNAHWLDPINPDTFPAGLLDAVTASTAAAAAATATTTPAWSGKGEDRSLEERLREQMRADALQPLGDDDDDDDVVASSPKNADYNSESHLPPKWIEDAAQFLRLNVSITYLRPFRGCCLICAPLFFHSPWQYLADDLCQARGTFGQHFAVFACGISLLFLVWHTV